MGYTMSYDASIKCKKADIKGLLHHNARDVDMQNNIIINHSNECINSDYTQYNQTYYYNHTTGEFEKCSDISQIEESLQKRLKAVKKPLRRDAVVLRSLILQLDPNWYDKHTNIEERNYSYKCMVEWVSETFGKQNIISFSIHNDETNPHIHVSFCPVTQDGRLSQKDFIDKNKLKRQHRSLREYMADKGFDIEMKNKKPGKYARRMSVSEYKDFAELQSEHEILDSAFRYHLKRKAELSKKESDLDNRESDLISKEKALQDKIKRFTEEAKQCQAGLLELANQYWAQPEREDALTRFAKLSKNKSGVSFYELFQKAQKKEKDYTYSKIAKQRELLNRFEEIANRYEQSKADAQCEMEWK